MSNYLAVFLLISIGVWALDPPKYVKYSFSYQEKILSNYSNLLERSGSEKFKKYSNSFSGFFLISHEMNTDFVIRFYFENLREPGNKNENAAGYAPPKEIQVFVYRDHSTGIISHICYPAFPGNEMDMVIKNILASVQHVKTPPLYIRNPVIEDFPDGRFEVIYKKQESAASKKKHIIILKKIKNWHVERGPNLGKTIIDSFFCRGIYGVKDSVLKTFSLLELKHQKLGQSILAYVKTILNVTTQNDSSEESFGYPVLSEPDTNSCLLIYKTFTREQRQRMISRNILKNSSLDEIINEVKMISGNNYSLNHDLVSKLRAALFLYPDFFNSIKLILDTADKQSLQFEILMTAVLSAENVPAQQYLAAHLENISGDYDKLRPLLAQIGVMTYVTDNTLFSVIKNLLYSANPNISAVAGLTVSNLANQYKYYNPYRYQMANQILFNHYTETEKNKTNLLLYIKEIGNAGDESKVDFLLNYLALNNDLKDEALYSCRFILSGKLDTAIAGLMIKNIHDSIVTKNIYETVKLRYPSVIIRHGIYLLFLDNKNLNWPIKQDYLNYLAAYADEIPQLKKEIKRLPVKNQALKKLLSDINNSRIKISQFDN